jgi:hypothetical protein
MSERWNVGFLSSKPEIPMFQYSIAAFHSRASEILLRSLRRAFFSGPHALGPKKDEP